MLGVLLLTQPWQGEIDAVGMAFAAFSALGWGSYILLTQRVGDRYDGVVGLAITIPVAALTAAVTGAPQAAGHLTAGILAAAVGLAFLLPVLPFTLEMLALRRLTPSAFGTLMALEPGFGTLLGLLLLHQVPAPAQLAGLALVVLTGRRPCGAFSVSRPRARSASRPRSGPAGCTAARSGRRGG